MEQTPGAAPDSESIRQDAISAGGLDPLLLRFRVVEYEKSSGRQLRIPLPDAAFPDAVDAARELVARNSGSHFCLEPVEWFPAANDGNSGRNMPT